MSEEKRLTVQRDTNQYSTIEYNISESFYRYPYKLFSP